jgi:hypothetical protein
VQTVGSRNIMFSHLEMFYWVPTKRVQLEMMTATMFDKKITDWSFIRKNLASE